MAFMRKKDVARALGITMPTLRAYERRGVAPYSLKMFGRCFYEERQVREFIANARRSQEGTQ